MKTMIIAASLALATLAGGVTAYAGEGIPNLPAQPLVSAAAPGVVGESYPAFTAAHRPVVSDRFASGNGGQQYPTFARPNNTTRFASAQIGKVAG